MAKTTSKATGIKGLKVIYDQLESSARDEKGNTAIVPKKYASYTAEDLYNQFLKVAPTAKGLLSSSYGASGWAISFDFYMDLVQFAIPGIFAVPIGGSVKPQRLDTAMLIIHRVSPKQLPIPAPVETDTNEQNPAPTQYEATPPVMRAAWQSNNPVCFNVFLGSHWKVEVKAGIQAFFALAPDDAWSGIKEVENAPSDDPEKKVKTLAFCELPLGLGGSASGQVQYEYQTLYVVDQAPGWYPSGKDQSLLFDFKQVLGEKSKGRLKLEISDWVSRFSAVFYMYVQYDFAPGDQAIRDQLQKQYLQIAKNTIDKSNNATNKSTSLRKEGGKKFMSFFSSFFNQAEYLLNRIEQKNIATADLIKSLQRLVELLPNQEEIEKFAPFQALADGRTQGDIEAEKATMTQSINELRVQAAEYIRRLNAIKDNPLRNTVFVKSKSRSLPDYCKHLSFFKAGSHAVGGNLGVNFIPGPGTVSGSLNGSLKATGFRYQTFSPSSGPEEKILVYTQDTRITYRQVNLKADASLGFLADPNLYEKNPQDFKGITLNGMTYVSACCYWLYPKDTNATKISPESGSGISFGASVYVKELNACAKLITTEGQDSAKYDSMVKKLAAELHIPPSVLIKFFNNEFFKTLTEEKLGGIKAVLIESSFRLLENFSVPLYQRNNDNKKLNEPVLGLKQIIGTVSYSNQMAKLVIGNQAEKETACAQYLDGLRVRVRMADHYESEISFKLGPHAVLSGSGGSPGITLSKITDAGQEGILDIYHVRFRRDGGGSLNPNTADASEINKEATGKQPGVMGRGAPNPTTQESHYEDAVPPVALLHQ